jgi:segregation and condensation protein A
MSSANEPVQPASEPAVTPDGGPDSWTEPVTLDVRAEDALSVHVPGFDGPLDLLLALARTHKIDLSQISVLALAEQYLAFVFGAKALRIELAGDYLVMAAWLAFLKSKLLLPREKSDAPDLSGEEMAARLAFRLKRLDAMRTAAAQLMTRKRLGFDIFPRGMPEGVRTIREREYTAEIYDLLSAYANQRTRTTVKRVHVVKKRTVWSIKDARTRLEALLGGSSGDWVQLDMYLDQYMPADEQAKTTLAASFGATLEMTRDGMVELQQAAPFAPIYMRRRANEDVPPQDRQKVE